MATTPLRTYTVADTIGTALYTVTDLKNNKVENPQDWPLQDLLRALWNYSIPRQKYVFALVTLAMNVARSPKNAARLLGEIQFIGNALDAENPHLYRTELKEEKKKKKKKRK